MTEEALVAEAEAETAEWNAHERQLYLGGVHWAAGKMACAHENTMAISGKCSDTCFVRLPDKSRYEGYAPGSIGVDDGGDYLDLTICLDCGKVVGLADKAKVIEVVRASMHPYR